MASAERPVLALDIGGTKLAVAVVTPDGCRHAPIVEPTRREEGPQGIIARLFDMGRRAIEQARLGAVSAVGISCGGPLNADTGVLVNPLHLPGWIDIPIVAMAEEAFGLPAALENDATAAALGEHRYGAGRGLDSLLYLTISTGIGGGAVIGGKLHRGAAGNGGEFGHVLVRSGGRECLCGRFGCLEAYASGSSIAARASEAVAARRRGNAPGSVPASVLAGLDVIRAEDVSAAAQAGDPLAREVWDETIELLSSAITDLVNIFEPELVVLGGGVTRAGDPLIDPIRTAVLRDAMAPAARAVRIQLADLGDAVCVVGAAAVALDLAAEQGDEAPDDERHDERPYKRPGDERANHESAHGQDHDNDRMVVEGVLNV